MVELSHPGRYQSTFPRVGMRLRIDTVMRLEPGV